MHLTELLAAAGMHSAVLQGEDAQVRGITADSRSVQSGYLFCAISGASDDGAKYIEDAIRKGASAVLRSPSSQEATSLAKTPFIEVENPRLAYAQLCAAFWPRQPRYCVAVTGTNGKTSVAEFYRQICESAGHKAASIGTLGLTRSHHPSPRERGEARRGAAHAAPTLTLPHEWGRGYLDAAWRSGNTSPAPEVVHEALQRLAEEGVHNVALEASSHGLHQYRLHGVRFAATAFTNLTQDHLDYHKDMEDYFQAKARLFADFDAPCVINADNETGVRLLAMFPRAKAYGKNGDWLRLLEITPKADGLRFAWQYDGQRAELSAPLYGAFQIENLMAAAGLALACGIDFQAICRAVPTLSGVRGRMQQVAQHPCGAPIFIDYAHTPDALKHLLISLRPHCAQKLHVVFGCGGDRDTTKRAPMGCIAAQHADRVIVTDDNPRTEDAAGIRRQILKEAPGAIEIADRAQAIQQAIRDVGAGDLLVVAGKGHEDYQIIGETKYDFNDAHIIKEALGAL